MEWKNLVNIDNLEFGETFDRENYRTQEGYPKGEKEKVGSMAKNMGAKKLGFHMEILLPGNFSCPYHFHHSEEELFLVLEGKAMVRQKDQFRELKKGDLIFFETGPEGAHQFYNHTDEPFKFLALSTKDPLEVCEYPDSGKMASRAIREVFEKTSAVDYWKAEEDPGKYWPEEHK